MDDKWQLWVLFGSRHHWIWLSRLFCFVLFFYSPLNLELFYSLQPGKSSLPQGLWRLLLPSVMQLFHVAVTEDQRWSWGDREGMCPLFVIFVGDMVHRDELDAGIRCFCITHSLGPWACALTVYLAHSYSNSVNSDFFVWKMGETRAKKLLELLGGQWTTLASTHLLHPRNT